MIIFIFFIPDVHKIINSFCFSNFTIDKFKANKKESGINFVKMLVILRALKYKYVLKECPSSTINSKRLTDLTVQAIIVKANKIVTNDLKISLRK